MAFITVRENNEKINILNNFLVILQLVLRGMKCRRRPPHHIFIWLPEPILWFAMAESCASNPVEAIERFQFKIQTN